MKIKIEKGILITKSRHKRFSKYPFIKMEIGDSFAIRINNLNEAIKIRQKLYSACNYFIFHYENNWNFTIRILDNEVRIWRTK